MRCIGVSVGTGISIGSSVSIVRGIGISRCECRRRRCRRQCRRRRRRRHSRHSRRPRRRRRRRHRSRFRSRSRSLFFVQSRRLQSSLKAPATMFDQFFLCSFRPRCGLVVLAGRQRLSLGDRRSSSFHRVVERNARSRVMRAEQEKSVDKSIVTCLGQWWNDSGFFFFSSENVR